MIYVLTQQQYDDINAQVPGLEVFGYQDGANYLFNSEDIVLYTYSVDTILQSLYSLNLGEFLATLPAHSVQPGDSVHLSSASNTSRDIPKFAVVESDDVFESKVTHNFCDTADWPAVDDSCWLLEPASGNTLILSKAEVQFLHDVQINGVTELYFDTWVYNPLFDAGQAVDADDPTFIPGVSSGNPLRFLYERKIYKNIRSVLETGNLYATLDPIDGETEKLSTIQFNYTRAIALNSSQGAQVRVCLKDNTPINGSYLTITFVTSEFAEES